MEDDTLSPFMSNDLIAQRPFAFFSAKSRPVLESPFRLSASAALTQYFTVRVDPSVVMVASHCPPAILTAACAGRTPASIRAEEKRIVRLIIVLESIKGSYA